MDAQQWDDLADMVDFEPDKSAADIAYDFLKEKVEGRGWTLSDLGCGPGSLTARLGPLFNRVRMIDFSRKMLERAYSEVTGYGVTNVEILQEDITTYVPDVKTDVALACACPPFYRVSDAPKMEIFATKACVLIMPTLVQDSPVRKILKEMGVDVHPSIDAELVEADRSRCHHTESVLFFETREMLTPLVMKNRCIRYTDGSSESVKRLDEIISSMDDDERYYDRWSKLVYWELE
ncbi:MAG: class I SAM-dependent methyltransferase [archaeon]|nr:class I SAM-dependent methyltransferase [archaeon]